MKVFNITDVETPNLKQRGLVDQTLHIAGKSVGPGQSTDVEDTHRVHLQHQVDLGVLALDEVPEAYGKARGEKSHGLEDRIEEALPPSSPTQDPGDPKEPEVLEAPPSSEPKAFEEQKPEEDEEPEPTTSRRDEPHTQGGD